MTFAASKIPKEMLMNEFYKNKKYFYSFEGINRKLKYNMLNCHRLLKAALKYQALC